MKERSDGGQGMGISWKRVKPELKLTSKGIVLDPSNSPSITTDPLSNLTTFPLTKTFLLPFPQTFSWLNVW